MNILKWLDNALARLEGWFIAAFLWLMVVLTFAQVCLRGLYTHAHLHWANVVLGYLGWSESLVRVLVLWLTFLGASLLTRENKHIKIDLFSSVLPAKWITVRELALSMVCVFICAVMLKVCLGYVKLEMSFKGTLFLDVPNWVGQLILPGGFAMILFRFSLRAIGQGWEILRGATK